MAEYTAPAIEKIADYSKVTRVNKPLDMQSTVVLFHFIPLRSSENLGE